jgi:hypothetical protein
MDLVVAGGHGTVLRKNLGHQPLRATHTQRIGQNTSSPSAAPLPFPLLLEVAAKIQS